MDVMAHCDRKHVRWTKYGKRVRGGQTWHGAACGGQLYMATGAVAAWFTAEMS